MILTASLVKTSLYLVPALSVEFPIGQFYVSQATSAQCSPETWKLWNPKTVKFGVEAGAKYNALSVFVGHESNHNVGAKDTEQKSFDYVGVSFKKEFK